MEDLEPNVDLLIRVWAPDPVAHPKAYENMCKLAGLKGPNGETLASILQANGVTSAEITPPFQRDEYIPESYENYEIFAAPTELNLIIEGRAIKAAIKAATGLHGAFNNPFSLKYEFQDYIRVNKFTPLQSIQLKRVEAL